MATEDMFIEGDRKAPILVICEPPDDATFANGHCMTGDEKNFFMSIAEGYGFSREDFAFTPCSLPMPEECVGDRDQSDHLALDRDAFLRNMFSCDPALIMPLGKHALRQVTGRAAQIGKARGQLHEVAGIPQPVLPMFGVRQCLWFPENINIFVTDFNMAATLDENDYDPQSMRRAGRENTDYRWTLDLTELLDKKPKWMAVDTETTGLKWTDPNVRVLTVQLTPKVGKSLVVPVDMRAAKIVYPDMPLRNLQRAVARARRQIRTLLEDLDIKKIGHNIKFDHHQIRETLGYKVQGWFADTQQLAFVVDDNMVEKSLDEVTRRWVPEMAGYADEFNRTANKADMLGELRKDPAKFLLYAAQDTDANYRGARALVKLAQRDQANWKAYRYIQLPALLAFADKIEPNGLMVDLDRLAELEITVGEETEALHERILSQLPASIRRANLRKGLKLSRPDLKISALFCPPYGHPDGMGLRPLFFTKGTRHKVDHEKIPTVGKEHLIYFGNEPLVEGMLRWSKLDKMRGTYVGKEYDHDKGGPTGFWKHVVRKNGVVHIHPSFFLHRTSTGRTASADPNAQNFPKRGDLAKAFRSIFIAPPGWKIIEADLSQAELRIAACQAGESRMIGLYNDGMDIHMNTAAAVSRNPLALFTENKDSLDYLTDRVSEFNGAEEFLRRKTSNERAMATVAEFIGMQRFQAKAVNFGFLYGMQWRKFMIYAKTDYGLDYTEKASRETRELFFENYPGLVDWHYEMEREVFEHGYVRALHGAMRRLPSVYSTRPSVQQESVRQAINSPIQRFASDLGVMALWRLCRDCPDWIKPVAFIHDALLCYVREDRAEEGGRNIRWYMESNPLEDWFGVQLAVPILADVSIGDRLSHMNEISLEAERPLWHQQQYDDDPQYIMR
jgi:DNA polymerase I-like protein with 3'-5' exonuclease and polymerase domains/uracil-DNA glycosylase